MAVFAGSRSVCTTCESLQVDLVSLTEVRLVDLSLTRPLPRSTSYFRSSCFRSLCSSFMKAPHWLVKSVDVRCLPAVPSQGQQNKHFRYLSGHWCSGITVFYVRTAQFSDAQCFDLQKIIFQDDTMRGVIWRSKTAVIGMPLAIAAEGFLSRGSHNWLWKFLTVLDSVLDRSGLPDVDFLLPLVDSYSPIFPLSQMYFTTVLLSLSKFLDGP